MARATSVAGGGVTRRRRILASQAVLGLACAIYFITYMDRVNLATAAPYVAAEFHLSKSALGLVFSAYSYPYALLQPFGGLWPTGSGHG